MKDELQELTSVWYDIVCVDHHKDRDCHFLIVKKYSYGEKPTYYVEHNGYVSELPSELEDTLFFTHSEAYKALTDWLRAEITDRLTHYAKMAEDTHNDFNVVGAKKVYEKYKHLLDD